MDTNPHQISTELTPYDAAVSATLSPPLHPIISTFSATTLSLLAAHGGIISHYHPDTLSLLSSNRTHLDHISSILPLSATVSAVGSHSFSSPPGLHLFDSSHNQHASSILWSDPTDTRTDKSRVTAVASDESDSTHLFASFDCRHRENAILAIDKVTLQVVSEIGRQSGIGANSAALTKLTLVNSLGLLVGSSISGGAFGYSGYIRVWDIRSGKQVWETSEPGGSGRIGNRVGDTMADVDVDEDKVYISKVGSRSGDIGVMDMRKLGENDYDNNNDPWVYLEEPNPGLRMAGPVKENVVVCCWNGDVFVSRDGALEAWSSVKGEAEWGKYRRNYMDKEEDEKRGVIRKICGGGNRLFVVRENVEGVEVWESSRLSGVISVS